MVLADTPVFVVADAALWLGLMFVGELGEHPVPATKTWPSGQF